jgi:two-component system NtrC family response regulator
VVDDEPGMLKVLRIELSDEGYEVETAPNGDHALEIMEDRPADVVVTDVRMPGMSGEELMSRVTRNYPNVPVIIMTAYGRVEAAVQAMKTGAADYLLKPLNMDELRMKIEQALERRRMILELSYLREEAHGYEELVGSSAPMQAVFELIERVAKSDATVFVRGESGTGKELVARAIHRRSERKNGPFVPINCVALPAELLESELFGHVKGSFTGATDTRPGRFELADQGTIFLDEIGDMSPALQGKILRAIQERAIEPIGGKVARKVNVRIIAATNKDLEEKVRRGEFREDLYYRLNVVPVLVPPLRERKDDIPHLVRHFLEKYSSGKPPFGIGGETLDRLCRYAWPGNVRELENLVERAVVLADPKVLGLIDPQGSTAVVEGNEKRGLPAVDSIVDLPYREAKKRVLEDLDRLLISTALRRTEGNISRAAEQLGMHRKNLHTKMSELGLDAGEFTPGGGPEAGAEGAAGAEARTADDSSAEKG